MYHGNDRLINLAVGAVVVIVFLLIGRLKRSLRKPPGETYRCGRCRRTFQHLKFNSYRLRFVRRFGHFLDGYLHQELR